MNGCGGCDYTLRQGLGDPLIVLAALYWTAENRPEWVGIDGKTLLSTAFGIASYEGIKAKLSEIAPDLVKTIGDEALTALAGALLIKYGATYLGGHLQNFGKGLLLGVVANAMKQLGFTVEKLIGGIKLSQVQQPQLNGVELYVEQPKPKSLEDYVFAKYNVRL